MDISNAFEDGRACLERLGGRRRRGKVSQEEEAAVMESLKERFRVEYRKVWVSENQCLRVRNVQEPRVNDVNITATVVFFKIAVLVVATTGELKKTQPGFSRGRGEGHGVAQGEVWSGLSISGVGFRE